MDFSDIRMAPAVAIAHLRQRLRILVCLTWVMLFLSLLCLLMAVAMLATRNWFELPLVALNTYLAAVGLNTFRRDRKADRARRHLYRGMEGLIKSIKDVNRIAFEHYNDQCGAALLEVDRVTSQNPFVFRWR